MDLHAVVTATPSPQAIQYGVRRAIGKGVATSEDPDGRCACELGLLL